MAYSRTNWTDNEAPYLNANNLNNIEDGISSNEKEIQGLSMGEMYQGTWTPALGTEYPASPEESWSWYITGLDSNGYTFTTGDLIGRVANNSDKIIYNGTEWSMIDNVSNQLGYYLVDDVASMLALNPLHGALCNTYGYTTANDGGGGVFNYDSSLVGTNNGGTILNGWVRQYSGAISLLWFGIDNNNNDASATDNTTKMQTLFDMASEEGWQLFAPNGYYKIDAPITIRESLRLEGEGVSKSRSTTGDVNDRGFILKYIGTSTTEYLLSIADPSPSTSVYMYGTHLHNIRLDCGGSQNGVEVRGVNEAFNMEDIEVGNYTHIGMRVREETTTSRVNNQATFRRIKLTPKSTIVDTAQGLVISDAHRLLFEAVTVDAQGSDSTEAIFRGFVLNEGTRNNVFINCYAENCSVGFQVGSATTSENEVVIGNVFINASVEAPEFQPQNTTVGAVTDTIAFLVNDGVKHYSINGLLATIQFGSAPNTYGYLLYDNNQARGVSRGSGTTNDKLSNHIASENKYGKSIWINDSLSVDNSTSVADDETDLTENSRYPTVLGSRCVITNNSTQTLLTGFADGIAGQLLELRIGDSNTTIESDNSVNGDSILLSGGADVVTPAVNSMFVFRKKGSTWIETSRMER